MLKFTGKINICPIVKSNPCKAQSGKSQIFSSANGREANLTPISPDCNFLTPTLRRLRSLRPQVADHLQHRLPALLAAQLRRSHREALEVDGHGHSKSDVCQGKPAIFRCHRWQKQRQTWAYPVVWRLIVKEGNSFWLLFAGGGGLDIAFCKAQDTLKPSFADFLAWVAG